MGHLVVRLLVILLFYCHVGEWKCDYILSGRNGRVQVRRRSLAADNTESLRMQLKAFEKSILTAT